jgi:tetratricopeptide (TPR) repeat protein
VKPNHPRQPSYGFFGRDVDILRIEKRLLGVDGDNILLVRGMGGAGKSTLLHHLGAWWQQTGLVERVFYFGWDEKAWTRQQILHASASTLYDAGRFHGSFLPLGEDLQQEYVAETLRGDRHLLILDNLESITGSPLAIQNTLSPDEQSKLREFLSKLSGGRTLVLLGSRGGEEWLASATFGVNVHTLQGLDAEAASDLAERVLARHGATARRTEPKFRKLMTLLAGYPLALEVVLANLKARSAADVLAALEEGAAGLDAGCADKTANILRCIEYSHGNLSAEAQILLACLAPFTGVIYQPHLAEYSEQLRAQPPLAHLPFGHWQAVLKEASDWGLLTADPDVPGFLRIQPVLPYFLRQHLAEPALASEHEAIETAFRQHYDGVAAELSQLLASKEAQERKLGQSFADREYANLATALRLALRQRVSILNPYDVLSGYLDAVHDEARGLELAEMVIEGLKGWPKEKLTDRLGLELIGMIADRDAAGHYLKLKRYPEAEAAYKRALQMVERAAPPAVRKGSAGILHNLGVVAQEQRRWAEAEGYYKQALRSKSSSTTAMSRPRPTTSSAGWRWSSGAGRKRKATTSRR